MSTREESLSILKSLEVAPIFEEAYRTTRLPLNLDMFFGCPEEFFLAPETQGEYTEGRLIPILDDGNFGCVLFYDPVECLLVQKYVEIPHEVDLKLKTWQQYLASLMLRILEADCDEADARQIAELIGFQHIERTLKFVDSNGNCDWHERRAAYIATI